MTATWVWLLVAGIGVLGARLAGVAVPDHWLEAPGVARVVDAVPAAMLAALAAVAVAGDGGTAGLDPALVAGTAAGGGLALTGRGGLLTAMLVGCGVTALLRLVGV